MSVPDPAVTDWVPLWNTGSGAGAYGPIPMGSVIEWPWLAAGIPVWAALPYGQNLPGATYVEMQALAAAASFPYGGTATVPTNFTLPDYRGRTAVGKDDMGGTSPNWTGGTAASRITAAISGINGATLGAVGGSEGMTLTTGMLPAHNHGVTGGVSNAATGISIVAGGTGISIVAVGDHQHLMSATGQYFGTAAGSGGGQYASFGGSTYGIFTATGNVAAGGHGHSVTDPTHGHTATDPQHSHGHTIGTSNTGSGTVTPNVQPTIVVNKMMRVL